MGIMAGRARVPRTASVSRSRSRNGSVRISMASSSHLDAIRESVGRRRHRRLTSQIIYAHYLRFCTGLGECQGPVREFPCRFRRGPADGTGDAMPGSIEEAFRLLGVAADSDAATVAHAYRRLARATHPDLSPDPDAGRRFATLTAAYRLLADRAHREGNSESRHVADPGPTQAPPSPTRLRVAPGS